MPVDPAPGAQDGSVQVAGRVVVCPHDGAAVVSAGAHRVLVRGPVGHLVPGDLVRMDCTEDPRPPGPEEVYGVAPQAYLAHGLELVFRPTRTPWAWNTESGRALGEGLLARLGLRAAILAAIRGYFTREGFLEVETPAIATSPGLDLHLQAFSVHHAGVGSGGIDASGTFPSDLPPRDDDPSSLGYLITSPEYHMKRLLVGGVERCFQFARCFRAGELGRAHEPEFTLLEWYRAWGSLDQLLADTECVVRAAAALGPTPGAVTVRGEKVALDGPFERLTVREAFARYAPFEGDPVDLAERDEERFFGVLVDRVEPNLGVARPCFLSRYPARHASLARLCADDPTVCERVELYAHGVELCNGFVELTDPVEQRARLVRDQHERAARGLPVYPVDERFLAALEEGLPPAVGNALGIDRLVALVAGQSAIAEVIAFPERRR